MEFIERKNTSFFWSCKDRKGTKGQRCKGTKEQSDKRTKGKGTKGQSDKGTKGQTYRVVILRGDSAKAITFH